MKKYEKPTLYVEEIKSALFTEACNYTADSNGEPLPFDMGGVNLFNSDNFDCTLTPENMGIEICFHTHDPNSDHNLFAS